MNNAPTPHQRPLYLSGSSTPLRPSPYREGQRVGREGHLIQERTEVSDQIFKRFDQANAINGDEVNGNDGNEARQAH